jgi:AAA family ATP:ADP antiporter
MILPLLQVLFKPLFGEFEKEEFKKFLRMGLIFAFIIGSYWTLRVLKDSIFMTLVDKDSIPWAKTASILCLFPLIMVYTKLLDKLSRERMFYTLAAFYGIATVIFAILLLHPALGQASADVIAARTGFSFWGTKILGYAWYVFVESYGSLIVALFWAIVADMTMPESAKKGFPLVVAIGQFGGIIGPRYVSSLPKMLGHTTSSISVFICSALILSLIALFKYFVTATPKNLLVSFHGKNEAKAEAEQEPGFLEGLKLLVQNKYLLGIFAVICSYEIIVTIFDYHFKYLAGAKYQGVELDAFLGEYGSMVNTVSLVCLLLGISNITRILGVGIALAAMPIIVAGAVIGFMSFSHLQFLFYLMVGSKAINYALNGPALKQLYIPTTHDARFKAQAWIETFGSRGSKEAGSIINMGAKSMGIARHAMLSGYLSFAIVTGWFFVALYLGRTFKKAIDTKTVIC